MNNQKQNILLKCKCALVCQFYQLKLSLISANTSILFEMHSKVLATHSYGVKGNAAANRLAMKRNEAEKHFLQQRQKSFEKEEKELIRQIQSVKKERYSHEFFNKPLTPQTKDISSPESYKRRPGKFIEVPVDLARGKSKSANLLTASNVARTISRFRKKTASCQERGQIVKLSMSPNLKRKVSKQPNDNIPPNFRRGRRHTIASIGLSKSNTAQRKFSVHEEDVSNLKWYFVDNEELENTDLISFSSISELKRNLTQDFHKGGEKKNSSATSYFDKERAKVLLCPSEARKKCSQLRRTSSPCIALRSQSIENLKGKERQSNLRPSRSHGELRLDMTQTLKKNNKESSIIASKIYATDTKQGNIFLNDSIRNKSCFQDRRSSVSSTSSTRTEIFTPSTRNSQSTGLEKATNPSCQLRRGLNCLSATEKTIATQTILRQLEIEQGNFNARKLAQKRLGDTNVDGEEHDIASEVTKRDSYCGVCKTKTKPKTTNVEKPSFREREENGADESKSVIKRVLLKSKTEGMQAVLDALSRDLEDCRYLRREK